MQGLADIFIHPQIIFMVKKAKNKTNNGLKVEIVNLNVAGITSRKLFHVDF